VGQIRGVVRQTRQIGASSLAETGQSRKVVGRPWRLVTIASSSLLGGPRSLQPAPPFAVELRLRVFPQHALAARRSCRFANSFYPAGLNDAPASTERAGQDKT
jgi:hypothetical protein